MEQELKTKKLLKSAGFLLGILAYPLTYGATSYVEIWGSDTASPPCGAKSNPCATIHQALGNATPGSRIVVGPGVYHQSNELELTHESLKVESTAGRFGTIIMLTSNGDGVVITTNKVQFGKKRKGFSIIRDGANGGTGIKIDGESFEKNRIEGNLVMNFNTGILIEGERHQVRHNTVENTTGLGATAGIDCDPCWRSLILDNTLVSAGGEGIRVKQPNSDFNTIQRNLVLDSGARGISFESGSERNKARDNVVSESASTGISSVTDISDDGSNLLLANIASRNGGDGFMILESAAAVSSHQLKDNLAVQNNGGIRLRESRNARIERNSAVQNESSGFAILEDAMATVFKNNNSYGTVNSCGILQDLLTATSAIYQKHFFGSAAGPGAPADLFCTGSPPGATFASKPNAFRAKRAARL